METIFLVLELKSCMSLTPSCRLWVEFKTSSNTLSLLRPWITGWWLDGQMGIYSRCIQVPTAQTTSSSRYGHMWPHSFNNVASDLHIKEQNHPVYGKRSRFKIKIQAESYDIMWQLLYLRFISRWAKFARFLFIHRSPNNSLACGFALKQVVLVLQELGSQVSTWWEIMESRSNINLTF